MKLAGVRPFEAVGLLASAYLDVMEVAGVEEQAQAVAGRRVRHGDPHAGGAQRAPHVLYGGLGGVDAVVRGRQQAVDDALVGAVAVAAGGGVGMSSSEAVRPHGGMPGKGTPRNHPGASDKASDR